MDPSHESGDLCDWCPVRGFCITCASAALGLQNELRHWTASSSNRLLAGEEDGKFTISADVLDLTCIMCKKDIFPPVFQCQNGHLACIYCSEKGIPCPACSRSISRIKNVALEKVITSATVGCKYTRLGCREVCNFLAREAHEKFCTFEPKLCSVPGCNQADYEDRFSHHLKTKHNVDQIVDLEDCTSGGEYSLMANICLDSSNSEVLLTHQSSHDRYLLHQEITSSGELLHITSLEQAPKRKYEIAVEVNDDQTYCYKSMTTSTTQQQQGHLLVPKHSGAPLKKMRCTIKLD